MIHFAICDDCPPVTSQIEEMIHIYTQANGIECHTDIFFDGETLWESFQKRNGYDIVFMDIKMKMDGITTAKKIRDSQFETIIIYISSYTMYMIELFEVEPFRFIEKPVDPKIFYNYLELAIKRVLSGHQNYSFRFRQSFYNIPVKEILYFESRLHTIYIHTQEGTLYQTGKLNEIETILKNGYPPFLRIHQSFLVNPQHIRILSLNRVVLNDNTVLKISETRKRTVQEQYVRLMEIL